MMDGELENHLNEEKASSNSNRRNGKTKKTVRGLNTYPPYELHVSLFLEVLEIKVFYILMLY